MLDFILPLKLRQNLLVSWKTRKDYEQNDRRLITGGFTKRRPAAQQPMARDSPAAGPVLVFHRFFCPVVNSRACTDLHRFWCLSLIERMERSLSRGPA